MGHSLFELDFHYRVKLINTYISIIQSTDNGKRISNLKFLIFRMMKDVVNKNIKNYQKLITNSGLNESLEYDELVSECYLVFEKCLEKYNIELGKNFYFYFNKSLSRNFYRLYQKKGKFPEKDTDENYFSNSEDFHIEHNYSIDFVVTNIGKFSEIEKRIIKSKCNNEKQKEFLLKNKDISVSIYNKNLENIKKIFKNVMRYDK